MYSKGKRSWIKHIDFIFIDIISLEAALILAYAIRFPKQWLFNDVYFAPIAGFIILFDVCIAFFTEPYNGILRRNKYQELRYTFLHYTLVFAAVLTHLYAVKISFYYSRQTLFTFIVIAFVMGYFLRCIRKRKIRRRKLSDTDKNSMIAIVEASTAERCLTNIAHNGYLDFKVGGVIVLDKDMTGEVIQGIPVVATADSCLDYIRENVVDEVFIDENSRESAESLANTLVELGLTVHVSLVSSDLLVINRKLEIYGSYVCLTSSMRIASDLNLLLKRFTDVVGSLVGLVITGLAFIIFAPIIKLQSPGPIMFKH